MTENALKCRFNGGNGLPYGYTVDEEKHFQIDPLKAPIVAEIFERYAHGESIIDIVRSLNARGLKTQKGAEFNNGTLNRMFTNKSHMGVYHYNGIEIPGGAPAIVSAETFEVVQQRMAKNKRAAAKNKAKEKYILTTKLFCGKCHSMMVADSANKKDGSTYRATTNVPVQRGTSATRKPFVRNGLRSLYLIRLLRFYLMTKLSTRLLTK